MIGIEKKDKGNIYLIDFGLSKKLEKKKSGENCVSKYLKKRGFVGTARYSSINA